MLIQKVSIKNVKYIFCKIENVSGVITCLFRTNIIKNGLNQEINTTDVIDFKVQKILPFLIATDMVSMDEYKIYGRVDLINSIKEIEQEIKSKVINAKSNKINGTDGEVYLETKIELDNFYYHLVECVKQETLIIKDKEKIKTKNFISRLDYRYKDFESVTISSSATNKKVKPFTDKIPYEEVDLFNLDNKKSKNATLATKAKSLQYLRLTRDLSFYYNEDGSVKKNYVKIDNVKDLKKLVDEVFPKIKLLVVDIETTGLNMYKPPEGKAYDETIYDTTSSIMFSWAVDSAIFIPIDMATMKNIEPEWVDILRPWLEKLEIVGANIAFDARGLYSQFGIKLNVTHDVLQLAFNLNCYVAKFHNSLKYLEHKFLKVDTLELVDIFGKKKYAGFFRYLPEELCLIYACPDVDMCLQLLYILWDKLPVSCRDAYLLDMKIISELYKMDSTGNRVDMKKAKMMREKNREDIVKLKNTMFIYVGRFLAYKDKFDSVSKDITDNLISIEDGAKELENFLQSQEYKKSFYEFNINSDKELNNLMFNKLNYPIVAVSETTGEPSIGLETLQSWMKQIIPKEEQDENKFLTEDIESEVDKYLKENNYENSGKPLISAKKINELKLPMSYLITEYRLYEKRETTFYAQLIDKSLNGYYCTNSNTARAETFRIINTVQVLQGFMKQLILPYTDEYYHLVFDFSQIEYRNMAGISKLDNLINILQSPRADFHTECCSLLHSIKPWLVTHDMRKKCKAINFAIPYGKGIHSLCKDLFGVVTSLTLEQTKIQYAKWLKEFSKIWDTLEAYRDEALKVGYVKSPIGRRRYLFDNIGDGTQNEDELLAKWREETPKAKKAFFRRACGNFPIQSGSADIMKSALKRFRDRLEKEGIADLVKTTANVHDELVNSVHKSVNPYFLYKIIYEEVMLSIKGHPRYYAGISICDNWAEGKEDLYEAPIEFVEYIINQPIAQEKFVYQEDAKNSVLSDIRKFITELIMKEFNKIDGFSLNNSVIELDNIIPHMKDYFIRKELGLFYETPKKGGFKKSEEKTKNESLKGKVENDSFIKNLEAFLKENGTLDKYTLIYPKEHYIEKSIITKESAEYFYKDENNSNENNSDGVTNFFIRLSKNKKENVESVDLINEKNELELDSIEASLDLDFDNSYEDSSLRELNVLSQIDDEEYGSVYYSGLYDYEVVGLEEEYEDILENPEKYKIEVPKFVENVKISNVSIIIDITEIGVLNAEKLKEYLGKKSVDKSALGAREIMFRKYGELELQNIYVKAINGEELRTLVKSKESFKKNIDKVLQSI